MVWVDPDIAAKVAKLPEVHLEIVALRDRMAAIAEADFASHDHPGRHELTKQDERIDALLSLDGPAPMSVEFGHWSRGHKKYVEGLHIIGKAAAAMEAEGRV